MILSLRFGAVTVPIPPIFRENRHVSTNSAIRMVTYAAALCLALAVSSCSILEKKKKNDGVAEARIVVGSVSFSRDGESHSTSVGTRFMPHDAISTRGASKIKISSGSISVFVNEEASFRFLPPTAAESCVVSAEKGGYYFSVPEGGRPMQCRFGDMAIGIAAGTYAALEIDTSGRLAEFFVLGGRAMVRRGGESKTVSSCEVVVLDAAGISEDESVTEARDAAIARLKGWVGETVIDKAVSQGICKSGSGTASAEAAEKKAELRPAASPAPKDTAARPLAQAPAPLDTVKTVARPQPVPMQTVEGFMIEHIVGPRRIFSGEEFTLKCGTAGRAPVTSYMWRFDGVGEQAALKTEIPQVTTVLEKTGEFIVTCEIMGDRGMLASQTVRVWVVQGQVSISAGGPYKTMLNKPVKMLGNANSHKGKIARYEWYVTHSGKPDYILQENAAVSHTFAKSGDHKAVFAVRLADGSTASDTATVSVGSLRPTANAGADVMPKSGAKVKLKGTGSSPDGKIVKYEWDFDGDGAFDWSSESSGETEHVFKDYANAVFRVTDTEGNTATDTMRVVICPKDMAAVASGKFCVDRYEWPNRSGAAVLTNVNWQEAAKTCEDAGKRLCAPDEWKRACRNGSDYKPVNGNSYPYGDEYDDLKCNTLGHPKARNALMPTGALGECAGALDIYDMSGNAAEWTAPASASAKAQAFGGFYQSGAEESGCESSVTLDKDKKYLYTGFRCCK
jgi:hypothetical protein